MVLRSVVRPLCARRGVRYTLVDEKIDPAHTRSALAQALAEAPTRRGRHKNIPL